MNVKHQYYKVFASILNDFGEGRTVFTYEEFIQAVESLGFKHGRKGSLLPPRRIGKGLFPGVKEGTRVDRVVSPEIQDRWKVKLFQLYGWTEDTFHPC